MSETPECEASSSGSSEKEAECPIQLDDKWRQPVLMRKEDMKLCLGGVGLLYQWVAWCAGVADPLSARGQVKMQDIFGKLLTEMAELTPTEWGLSVTGRMPFGFAREPRELEPRVKLCEGAVFKQKLDDMRDCYQPFGPDDYAALMGRRQTEGGEEKHNGFEFVKDAEDAISTYDAAEFVRIPIEQLYVMALMSHTIKLSSNIQQNAASNAGALVHWQSTAPFFNFVKEMERVRERGNILREDGHDPLLRVRSAGGDLETSVLASEVTDAEAWGLATGFSFASCVPLESPLLVDRYWTRTGNLLNLVHETLVSESFDPETQTGGAGLRDSPVRVALRVRGDRAEQARDFIYNPMQRALLTSLLLTFCEPVYMMFRCPLSGKCV